MGLGETIQAARGDRPADLLLTGGRVVNVFTAEVVKTAVAIRDGRIVGLGDYEAAEVMDLGGAVVLPGLIDGHVHIESSMLTPGEFARAVVPHGTTAVVADPHEIANVLGVEGIRYMLRASEGIPLDVFLMVPSCVPATHMETAGAVLGAEEMAPLLRERRVIGIAEMMNFPGVIHAAPEVLRKLELGNARPVDGHAPGLTGRDLMAYVAAGIGSDHECTTREEAIEKVRLGMHVMIREGSRARNLRELVRAVTPETSRRFFFVSDDREPADLLREGSIDHLLRLAIDEGLPPVTAVQMATLNAALYFGLDRRGAVAPGYHADLVVADDLASLRVRQVFKGGRLVASEGRMGLFDTPPPDGGVRGSVRYGALEEVSLRVPAGEGPMRVIGLVPDQIVTRTLRMTPRVEGGWVVADPGRDLLKMVVVERHRATGNVGTGFVTGIGLREGALASSVAHDSHNVVGVGASDSEILHALREVERMGGGLVAVAGGRTLAALPLPVAGLMSDGPAGEVAGQVDSVSRAARDLGSPLRNAFLALAFLTLPVIPELKLTDRGLVDVGRFEIVPLFGDGE